MELPIQKKKYDYNIFEGDLLKYNGKHEFFDVITFWDVIEHVEYPLENLQKAYDLLKPGGLILITSDNYNSLISKVADLSYRISCKKFKYAVERFFIPYNRSFFTDYNFCNLFINCGFEVTYFEKMEYPLKKINANFIERIILNLLYGIATLTGKQAQFTLIGQKKNENMPSST